VRPGCWSPHPPGAGGGTNGLLVAAVVLVAVSALLTIPAVRSTTPGTVPRALGVWSAVVGGGVVASVVSAPVAVGAPGGAYLTPDFWYLILSADGWAHVRASAGWGVAYGWLVALLVARVAWRRDAAAPRGADPTARTGAVVAAVLAGGGWLLLVAARGAVLGLVDEHAPAHPGLAWQVRVAATWLLPVGTTHHAAAGSVLLAAVLVAAVVGSLTWWMLHDGGRRAGSFLLVQAVWLACVVGATLGPVPTASAALALAPEADLWLAPAADLGRGTLAGSPADGGAAGLLYGWWAALGVVATLAVVARRGTRPPVPGRS